MTKGLARSLSRGKPISQNVVKQRIPVRNVPITITDPGAANAWGTAVLGDFDQGNMLYLGAVAYLQFNSTSAGLTTTWTGSCSLGTAPTADNVLSGAEIDLIPATTIAAATNRLSPLVRMVSTDAVGGGIFDNQNGSLEYNLNVLVDDAAISANSALTVSGYLEVAYIIMGDN